MEYKGHTFSIELLDLLIKLSTKNNTLTYYEGGSKTFYPQKMEEKIYVKAGIITVG